jgi:signal transduction histidine kinase
MRILAAPVRTAVFAVVCVTAVGVEFSRWAVSDVGGWLPDLGVGLVFIAAGLWIGGRVRGERQGLLVGLVGVAWLASNVVPIPVLLYRGVLVHAALAMPRGRVGGTSRRLVVVAGYIVSVVPWLAGQQVAGLLLGVATAVAAWPSRSPDRAVAVLTGGVLAGIAAAQLSLGPEHADVVLIWAQAALMVVALGFVLGHQAGPDRSDLTDLVVELGPADALTRLAAEEPDVAHDEAYRDAVAAAERLVRANAALAHDLRESIVSVDGSRRRLHTVDESERAALEVRLQQGPVARLDLISGRLASISSGKPDADAALAAAREHLAAARADLARIARGLYPAAVVDGDLEAAMHALAAGSPVPVTVDLAVTRVAPADAATLYFVAAEGVANAVRHAGAGRIALSVRPARGGVEVEVRDDGRGGADLAAGTGLRGLADRLSLAGGSLTLDSPAGGGTALRGSLPGRASPVRTTSEA